MEQLKVVFCDESVIIDIYAFIGTFYILVNDNAIMKMFRYMKQGKEFPY